MNFVLNVLWIIFGGGIIIAFEYLIAGLLLCVTVVGIPFGLQAFKLAKLSLFPFGSDLEVDQEQSGAASALGLLGNILWLVFAGWWIFLSHVSIGIGLVLTIIGIPFALQHLKLAILSLWPFGRNVT